VDREGQTNTTAGTPLAERLGRVGLWTRQLDMLAVEQAVLLEEDPAEARRVGRESIAFYLTLPNYVRAWRRAGFGPEELADGGSDRLVDAMVAWGGLDDIAERVDAQLEAGADHVCLHVLDPDPSALPIEGWRVLVPALLGR
jgi:probable F420-dependent oxidoreductase